MVRKSNKATGPLKPPQKAPSPKRSCRQFTASSALWPPPQSPASSPSPVCLDLDVPQRREVVLHHLGGTIHMFHPGNQLVLRLQKDWGGTPPPSIVKSLLISVASLSSQSPTLVYAALMVEFCMKAVRVLSIFSCKPSRVHM